MNKYRRDRIHQAINTPVQPTIHKVGLLEQISVADTASEIAKLLEIGKGYLKASADTVSKWHRMAVSRLQMLDNRELGIL